MQNQDNLDHLEQGHHYSLTTPMIEMLSDEGFELIKQRAGFPDNFNRLQVSVWLTADHNKIHITRVPIGNNNNNLYKISSSRPDEYDPNDNNWVEDYEYIEMPLDGFTIQFVLSIHNILLNTDMSEYDNWLRYLNSGGSNYLGIYIYRYYA